MGLVQNMIAEIFRPKRSNVKKLRKTRPDQFLTVSPEAPSNTVYTSAFKKKGKSGARGYTSSAKSIEELLAEQAAMTGFK